jgi:hypothetical protein
VVGSVIAVVAMLDTSSLVSSAEKSSASPFVPAGRSDGDAADKRASLSRMDG